jgi:hypothetical protein
MSRADLLALTPQALASLSNLGLVKRAQRELAEGAGPKLHEEDDGTVVGTYDDGVVARLPKGATLKDSPCTCGATGVCRHRIAVALAYGPWHAAEHAGAPPPSARVETSWSPAEIDDATLERALGVKLLERARVTMRRGLVATLEHDAVPVARLPSCTVRFLVPRDVAYARCDCAQAGGACEHLALAVWAFRELEEASAAPVVVALGGGGPGASSAGHAEALEDALLLARELLVAGIGETSPLPARFARLRMLLARARMTWMHGIALDLEIALEGYHKRSALHGTREIAALLVELAARARAGVATSSELPPRFVLGEDEAPETLLDHVRLVSLGARVRADERSRFADVYLADPDTKLVLVLRKRWDFGPDEELQEGPALARRAVAAKIKLEALARGQLVSKVVTRLANRSIDLGTSRVAQTSVTPQRGDWDALPAPLLVRDLALHAEAVKRLPPRVLRPRVLAEAVHAVEVSAVNDVVYSAAEQKLVAELVDAAGHPFLLVLRHRRAAPNAIDATAAALARSVRFVAGELRRGPSHWELEPLAVAGEELVVPDLAGPALIAPSAGHALAAPKDPLDAAITRAESVLEELCNTGLGARARSALARADEAGRALDDAGLSALAVRVRAVRSCAQSGALDAAADAWLDAGLRLAVVREVLGG